MAFLLLHRGAAQERTWRVRIDTEFRCSLYAGSTQELRLAKRLVRWFTYNCLFALLPLITALVLHALADKLTIDAVASSPEILFFALMVSATAMGDLSEIATPLGGWDITFRILGSALLLGAVWSAILYGSLLYDSVIGPGSVAFRSRLLIVAVGLAAVLFVLSTLVEMLIGKIEGKK